MQNYRKSDYAINKNSPNIVYRFHNEIIEITLEDYLKAVSYTHLDVYKRQDLAMEFTTNESGDRIFAEGIVIPMTGIENYPYTFLLYTSRCV